MRWHVQLIATTALMALACEGSLSIERMEGGNAPNADTAPQPPSVDAGPLQFCLLPPEGECSDGLARWCEGSATVEVPCATGCAVDPALGRVNCSSLPGDGGTAPPEDPPPPPDSRAPTPPPPSEPACGSDFARAVMDLANEARASAGRSPLTCDPDMTRAALLHSEDMCERRYFSHTSLDGRSAFQRMRDEGVSYQTAGENIARGQPTPDEVHRAWMRSSGHRANILNRSFGRVGVGYAECGGRHYWTQNFAD